MQKAKSEIIANLKKQKRENKFLLFLDNAKIIKDALESGKIDPVCILSSRDELPFSIDGYERMMNGTEKEPIPVYRVDERTISQFASTVTHQHVVCVAMLISPILFEFSKSNFLVLDGLQDPGNVGTLIRTALAAGFENVILIESVNLTNDKLIRSSAGAVFSVNAKEMSRAEFVKFAKSEKLSLICTDMNGENVFTFEKPFSRFGIVVGNEGQGVSKEVEKICTNKVRIPMNSGIESLNAAVSGAIVMYQLSDVKSGVKTDLKSEKA